MKLTDKQVDKLSTLILNGLQKNDSVNFIAKEEAIRLTIKEAITKNLRDEMLLDEEVKKLMEAYSSQIEKGEVDSRKAFSMIKNKLAKEKEFVL
ncbi:MAG: DUF507 family protein [Proteobacteria bacterium]|nr:DUF507 family protein [Pseudomonadota bacterium]